MTTVQSCLSRSRYYTIGVRRTDILNIEVETVSRLLLESEPSLMLEIPELAELPSPEPRTTSLAIGSPRYCRSQEKKHLVCLYQRRLPGDDVLCGEPFWSETTIFPVVSSAGLEKLPENEKAGKVPDPEINNSNIATVNPNENL